MNWTVSMQLVNTSAAAMQKELAYCNRITEPFGLVLSEPQMMRLTEQRFLSLRQTGRIEFGAGVLRKLVYAFCDSPYVFQENYEATLSELQEIFYYFKNESWERLSDDALIEAMRRVYNGEAGGSAEYLAGKALEELCGELRGWENPENGMEGESYENE